MVTQALGEDPFCGTIFVLRSKRAARANRGQSRIELEGWWACSGTGNAYFTFC